MADKRQCAECGHWYPSRFTKLFFYRAGKDERGRIIYDTTCKRCRDSASWVWAAREKADRATVYRARLLGKSVAEMRTVYGWDRERMAADILHAYDNDCPCCLCSFKDVYFNGIIDIKLHIIDPAAEPYYEANVRWVCPWCSSQLRGMTPEEQADFQKYCEQHHAWKHQPTSDAVEQWLQVAGDA